MDSKFIAAMLREFGSQVQSAGAAAGGRILADVAARTRAALAAARAEIVEEGEVPASGLVSAPAGRRYTLIIE